MARKKFKQKRLSHAEKLSLLYGDGAWTIRGAKRVGLAPVRMADGPLGLRKVPDDSLSLDECVPSIAYPCEALTACSFDVSLMERFGKMLGRECRGNDVDVLLGPGINIKRNPLCGRNFEYYSEDPLVSGKMASAFIRGVQSVGVGACLKHFACNSQESYRMVNDSIVDERALFEIYLRGFEYAVKDANPWMVMASYNKVNGEYACESKFLLCDVLKGKWKYDGVVVSDWGAVNDPVLCHENGLDVEMPCYTNRFNRFTSYVRVNKSFSKSIDESAQRISLLSQRTHNRDLGLPAWDIDAAHAFAVNMAERSIVLAKNEGDILPLKNLKKVAIIGEIAAKPRLGGGGSSRVGGYHVVPFLDAVIEAEGEKTIRYAPGYSLSDTTDPAMTLDAIDLASSCDKVIYFMGTTPAIESEGIDRPDLRLPQAQVDLMERLAEVNPNIIVVLCSGAPVEAGFVDKAKAVFISYFSGEGGGEALYHLITGKANPCGHLAETWPWRLYEVPSFGLYPGPQMQSLYRESIYVGYRFYLTTAEKARFPFGHGLSYTHFRFTKLTTDSKKITPKEKLTVTVSVSNATSLPGTALVQLYVRPPMDGHVFKARRTLQAFRTVPLQGNEKKEIEIVLDRRAFEHYDVKSKSFKVEGGTYFIEIGDSCEEITQTVPVEIESEDTFESQIDRISIYYQPPKDGFWQYDDAFEALLGHVIPLSRDPRNRPFTINSTFGNIRDTFIGRKIFAAAEERLSKDPETKKAMMTTFEQMPIRGIILNGTKEKYAQVIVDLANGKLFTALWHVLVPKR